MRHGNKVNHLSRKTGHRKAMLSNMACSLIEHKRITTTLAKAKTLRVFVEPILTKSKDDSTHSRRVVFSYLQNKEVVAELFRDVAPKIASRNGGYTRIIRTGNRLGDNAEMCLIELVDFNEIYNNDAAKKTTRRSRRGGVKKADEVGTIPAQSEANEAIEEAVVIEDSTELTDAVQEESNTEEEAEVIVEEVAVAEAIEEVAEEAPVAEETAAEVIVEEVAVAEAIDEVAEEAPVAEETAADIAEAAPEDAPDTDDKKEDSES
jgi:large subunit ribosomal protein L17